MHHDVISGSGPQRCVGLYPSNHAAEAVSLDRRLVSMDNAES